MKHTVFIDGKDGTTGLKIYERFERRDDIEIIQIAEEKRKDAAERKKLINAADFAFLCLPDAAAVESAALCDNPRTKIIDASTAHRTAPGWAYGFPELSAAFRSAIQTSRRVAVPGCYASGFVALAYPLVSANIMPPDYPVVVHAVSGYSGAGRKAIAQYEGGGREEGLATPRLYALAQRHKHLPEMKKIPGLSFEPIFNPYICDYFQGMTVTVGLHARLLEKPMTARGVHDVMAAHYSGCRFVEVAPFAGEGAPEDAAAFIGADALAGTNRMQIFVCGNDERIVLTSRFDNLGKGASGAAVQCMNIMMGAAEDAGLS